MSSDLVQLKPVGAMQAKSPSARYEFVGFIAFVIPCSRFIEFHLIGVLNGPDILLLVAFLSLIIRSKIRVTTTSGKVFVALCAGWLVSQCVTDFVRRSAFVDYSRGWSTIGMTLTNFVVLFTLLYGKPRRIAYYGWGLVCGKVLTYLISPSELATDYPWKFGIADSVNWAVLLLASRKGSSQRWQIFLVTAMGLVNVAAGTRNQGGTCLCVALYLFTTRFMRNRIGADSRLSAKMALGIGASIVLGVWGIVWAYQFAASSGMLGDNARIKYEQQSSGQYGLLLGGRTEILGSIPAIYDSPILGHGSWAKDPGYLLAERQALALMGYSTADEISVEDLEEGLIPAHSHIFGAWVNAGILGAVFWGWVFWMTMRALMRVYPASVAMLPLGVFCAFSLLWELLFSPYGAEWRIITPYYIVIVMSCAAGAVRKPQLVSREKSNARIPAISVR
jgi:hypothetical protein